MKLTQLLLLNQNNQQCIRSGYCCIKAPCIFGSWNKLKTQCKHLKGNKPGKYYCDIKNEIVDKLQIMKRIISVLVVHLPLTLYAQKC